MKKIITHPSLIYADDLKDICAPLKALGIDYFAHVNVDEKSRFSALGMKPEFVKLYFEKKYYNYDIHMMNSRLSEEYVIWDTVERDRGSKNLYDDLSSFSIGHTFTVIQNNNSSKDCYHFAAKLGNEGINNRYLQHVDLLKKFMMHFTEKVSRRKELKSAYDVKFGISKENAGYFVTNEIPDADNHRFLDTIKIEKIYINSSEYLTKREFECLHWLSMGKTAEEVGLIMAITPRTIKAHIANIKMKLNCRTQFQLGLVYSRLRSILLDDLLITS